MKKQHLIKGILGGLFAMAMMPNHCLAQEFPSPIENIEFATTFGKSAATAWGDDDYSQVYFVAIPGDWQDAVYIRVFDGDVGGKYDEMMRGAFNTKCEYAIYGGKGSYLNKAAQSCDPIAGYDAGTELFRMSIGESAMHDDQWKTLAALAPNEGEWDEELQAYVFKIICTGGNGDDGNLYRYFASSNPNENIAITGATPFTYELSFRLRENSKEMIHFYPYIDSDVVSLAFHSFDFDDTPRVRANSIVRKNVMVGTSPNDEWTSVKQKIWLAERETSMDFRVTSFDSAPNDGVVYFTNQYGDAVPFFSTPIGGLHEPGSNYKSSQRIIRGE